MPKGVYKRDIAKMNLTGLKLGHGWNKGLRLGPQSEESKRKKSLATKGVAKSKETIQHMKDSFKNRVIWNKGLKNPYSSEVVERIREKSKNIVHTKEWNMKMGATKKGNKSHFWKGGITPINRAIRNSIEYEEWRTAVFERDLYICQDCGEIGGYLQADHIKPFSLFPELRFELSNGRTLCIECHKKTESYLNNKIRLEDYL